MICNLVMIPVLFADQILHLSYDQQLVLIPVLSADHSLHISLVISNWSWFHSFLPIIFFFLPPKLFFLKFSSLQHAWKIRQSWVPSLEELFSWFSEHAPNEARHAKRGNVNMHTWFIKYHGGSVYLVNHQARK